jgi:hypothetical protein
MSKTLFNLLWDALLLLLFLAVAWTAVVVRFVFPAFPEGAGWRLWGGDREAWLNLQFGLVAVLAFAILIHVMLHWSWICGVVVTRLARNKKARADDGAQTIYGVGLLIVILNIVGLAIAAAAVCVVPPA